MPDRFAAVAASTSSFAHAILFQGCPACSAASTFSTTFRAPASSQVPSADTVSTAYQAAAATSHRAPLRFIPPIIKSKCHNPQSIISHSSGALQIPKYPVKSPSPRRGRRATFRPMAAGKKDGKLTPMMAQYQAMRRSLPEDVLLLFRLGDFYEMFFEDAKDRGRHPERGAHQAPRRPDVRRPAPRRGRVHRQAHQGRQAGRPRRADLHARSPASSSSARSRRSSRPARSTTSSSSTTDGTTTWPPSSGTRGPSAWPARTTPTGEFTVAEFPDRQQLEDELARLSPSELLISDEQLAELGSLRGCHPYDGYAFLLDQATNTLRDHFRVQSLDGFGCSGLHTAVSAAGGILHYLDLSAPAVLRPPPHPLGAPLRHPRRDRRRLPAEPRPGRLPLRPASTPSSAPSTAPPPRWGPASSATGSCTRSRPSPSSSPGRISSRPFSPSPSCSRSAASRSARSATSSAPPAGSPRGPATRATSSPWPPP